VTTSLAIEAEAEIISAIATAAKLSAPLLRILPAKLGKGEGVFAGIARLGPLLSKIAGTAAANKITLAIQNAGGFTGAHYLWQLIEGSEHDSIAACLDVPTSTLHNESPILTVPTLNTRIAHVRVWDYKDSKPAALGQGEAKIKLAIERLRGIGYAHAVAYAPPSGVDLADDSSLKSIAHELQLWAGLIKPTAPEPAKPAQTAAAPAR
jgi:sugar phosphate isomerase/epimerase